MSLNLKSSGGGSVTVDVPSTASNYTATLPAANITVVGTSSAVSAAGQIPFSTDGSTFTPTAKIVSGTSVTASGTSVNFTDIPSWVKRITVSITGLSYAATGTGVVQIGSGSLTTTGYTSNGVVYAQTPTNTVQGQTNGFGILACASAASALNSTFVLTNVTGNMWSYFQIGYRTGDAISVTGNGYITLSGALDRLSLVATTSTFDAGTINILYE